LKKITKVFIFLFVFSILLAGLIGSNDADTSKPADLENQVKKEIKNAKLHADEINLTYNQYSKALIVELYKELYWDENSLKSSMFIDTVSILEVVANHPEIEIVDIEYQTMMLDKNYNKVRMRVYQVNYQTSNTNPMEWSNVYTDNRERVLREKADEFWLHPALTK